MDFLEKLDLLMVEKGIGNRKELSKKAGIPYTTIMSMYERAIKTPTAIISRLIIMTLHRVK
jgi:predicted transcriptional regulator